MRYRVNVSGRELELELLAAGEGRYLARFPESEATPARELEVIVVGDRPSLAVLIDGRVVELVPHAPQIASARGTRVAASLDEAHRRGRGARQSSEGDGSVRAPMPGRIVKVLLAPGQEVEAGQPALVIEAMKMENELTCAQSGRVKEVLVAPNVTVERGALLVVVEPA